MLRVNLIHISPPLKCLRYWQETAKKKKRVRGRVRPPLSLQILSICHITFKQHEKLRERPCTILCEGCQTQCRSSVPTAQSRGHGPLKFRLIIVSDCALSTRREGEHVVEKKDF